ncbi:hypothetical protein SteCoe_15146 [Stentor coeruleus]|uniref:RING-type domain-containing protein n=1 Tax=Stentor coeruleus TaxID=5963 RepID=A0A1R2C4B0_9CILI|nr:hypothetical protein SteCoe_15146 [Stentor coeruleus]
MNQSHQIYYSTPCILCCSTQKLLAFSNNLILCRPCYNKYKKSSKIICQHCNTPCMSFLPCKHPICSICISLPSIPKFCILCCIECCYCKSNKVRNSQSICALHKNCKKCAKNIKGIYNSCLICEGQIDKITCSKCKNIDFSISSPSRISSNKLCKCCSKDSDFDMQNIYENPESSMYNTKASSYISIDEKKVCVFCNKNDLSYYSFPCKHFYCYDCKDCKDNDLNECPLCEQCHECLSISQCRPNLCDHKLCSLCIKNLYCPVCIKNNTFRKCCACGGATLKKNLNKMTCSHKICPLCSENLRACSKCSKGFILNNPEKCSYCENPAFILVENNDSPFYMCEDHYYSICNLHEIHGEILVLKIENDEKLEILKNIDYQIKMINEISANTIKNVNEVVKKINEAMNNSLNRCSREIMKLISLKNDIIISEKIRKKDLEMISRRSVPYLFMNEVRIEKLTEKLCDLISTSLIEENLQDKYLSYYSPTQQGLVRLSLNTFSNKFLANNPNSFETGYQNQIVKISSDSYFICGGYNQISLSTAYIINMKSLIYKQLQPSHIPISKSSSIFIYPDIYIFLSQKKTCISFNLIKKSWSTINYIPKAYTNGTTYLYNSKIYICGTELENALIFYPELNIYNSSFALERGLKVFCDYFLLIDGDGVYKLLNDEMHKISYECDLKCYELMTSCVGKRGGKYYFVGNDEKVMVFDSLGFSVKVAYEKRK